MMHSTDPHIKDNGATDECARYLILGNGFDLECGLPTKYTDYIEFLCQISDLREGKGFRHLSLHEDIKRVLFRQFDNLDLKDIKGRTEAWTPAFENFWFRRFKEAQIKDGWVDFEKEIARVIRLIEECMRNSERHVVDLEDRIECVRYDAFWKVFSKELKASKEDEMRVECEDRYKDLRDRLSKDLDALIAGFERYLRDYVGEIEPTTTDNIEELIRYVAEANLCHVLTFNYTSTFATLLEKAKCADKARFCHVHGQVCEAGGKNSMVLGISETLTAEEKRRFIGFTHFNKFYQRIYKETDSSYMDWLGSHPVRRTLWAFGHSMGVTDRDILQSFITAEGMETTVFYHGEEMFKDQVTNLTEILGDVKVIEMTGGRSRSLRFVRQR